MRESRTEWDSMRDRDLRSWIGGAKTLFVMSAVEGALSITCIVLRHPEVLRATLYASWGALAAVTVWVMHAGRRYRRRWTGVPLGDPPLDSVERVTRPR